ncbi:MAG: RNA methyltransferase [Candidatus Omnitrophota bacterium]
MKKAAKTELKEIRELLRDKKSRDRTDLFVAEGLKIVRDIFKKGHSLKKIIVSESFARENADFIERIQKKDVPIAIGNDTDIRKTSSLHHPEGILAIVERPVRNARTSKKNTLKVLLDNVQDPGNVGAIIRISVAFGVKEMLFFGDCADIYNPKTIRASVGTIMDINIREYDLEDLIALKEGGDVFFAMEASGKDIEKAKNIIQKGTSAILMFGNEGRGMARSLLDIAQGSFAVPMNSAVESLNVISAAAIALYVFAKNRDLISKN